MWKKLLLKIFIQAVLFAVIFAGAALLTNRIMNRGMDTGAVEAASPTMHEVYALYKDKKVNCMQGYRTALNTSLFRDTILPVDSDKKVSILVPKSITGEVSYQLRDYTGQELIEEGVMTGEGTFEKTLTIYSVNLRMDLTRDKEYSFILLCKEESGETVRYYTRIKRMEKHYLDVLLSFAEEYSDQTFQGGNGPAGDSLLDKTKIEMDSVIYIPEAEDDLGRVSMGSGYDAIVWGAMKPEKVGENAISVKELQEDTAVICIEYFLCSLNPETNSLKYYSAAEYLTLKYLSNTGSAEVVDYRRYVDQSFTSEDFSPDLNSIRLGLTSKAKQQFFATEDSEQVAFEANDCLWYYNYNEDILINVYGEPVNIYSDVRSLVEDYRLNILSITKDKIEFSVLGRQNMGEREGRNGLALYRYDIKNNILTEQMFLELNLSMEGLEQETGRLIYFDDTKNMLYTYVANTIVGYDVRTGKKNVLAENVTHDRFLASDNMHAASFTEEDRSAVHVIDFETGEVKRFSTNGKETIGLGYIGEDLLYGTVSPQNISLSENGMLSFIYDSISIVDGNGTPIKSYSKNGSVIRTVNILNNTIYLSLATKNPDTGMFVDIEPDYITCRLDELEQEVKESRKYSDRLKTESYITFPNYIYMSGTPDEKIVKVERNSGAVSLSEEGGIGEDQIYIYLAGQIRYVTECFGDAAGYVTMHTGIAVDAAGNVIFKNRTPLSYNTVAGTFPYVSCKSDEESLRACMQMMLSAAGATVDLEKLDEVKSWNEIFLLDSSSSARGVNLTGAYLNTMIIYLSDGIPFVAKLKNRYVVVVSYNDEAIRYYDPVRGSESRVYRSSFDDDVDDSGNVFYTFTK